jgi:hypothetical protein
MVRPTSSIRLTTGSVVASYVHEISERHRRIDQLRKSSPSQPADG